MQYIAFDSHKRYTFASVEDHATGKIFDRRIDHEQGALREFLSACEPGSPVANLRPDPKMRTADSQHFFLTGCGSEFMVNVVDNVDGILDGKRS